MAYTKETILKVTRKAYEVTNMYREKGLGSVKICISKGNRKIGRVMNVSLMPILSCGNCKECSKLCYDIKACVQYNGVIPARVRNTLLAKENRDVYFAEIDKACSRRKVNKYFRWHVAGDILDFDYLENMIKIARNHPEFKFWTYTKMYGIVNEYCEKYGKENIPSNLTILFSEWRGMPLDNPFNFPIFTVRFKGEEAPKMHCCPGNCDICKANGHGCPNGESSYVDEH